MSQPITPDLVYELTSVPQPTLSPEGSELVFVQSSVDQDEMKTRSQLMRMRLPDGTPEPFTQGERDSHPRFSPDGAWVAFLRPDDHERRQLWLIPPSGGEARPCSDLPGGVSEFAWAPDARRLALVSDVDPDRPPDDHDPQKDPRTRVARRLNYRFDTLGWRGDAHRHLFIVDLSDQEPRQLTDGDWDDTSPVWSPDGESIAFLSDRREDREETEFNEVYVISAAGGEAVCWSEGLLSVSNLAWSPEGERLLAVGSADPDMSAMFQGTLYALAADAAPKRLTDPSIKPAGGFPPIMPGPVIHWRDDDRVRFLADQRGESFLFELDSSSGELRALGGGKMAMLEVAFDAAGERAVLQGAPYHSAGDLYLLEDGQAPIHRLTHANDAYFDEHPTAHVEKLERERAGMTIESRLLFPPDFDESRQYPLVVEIHGGPHGAFYDTFNSIQQILATQGYLVLCVNPRGSSTYGDDFVKAVLRDWGGEDHQDILDAVDAVCERPYVDDARLGVHGYSYGGFMSSWIVGHDQRFGAAVVGAPCTDLPSFYGTADIGVPFGEVQWGGTRMDALDWFVEHSPLTYAPHVETPVLLLHGEVDYRCPIGQSEQYFTALKRLGKTVEFVRFPDCSHLFLRMGHPKLRAEYFQRTLDWFERHIGEAESEAD
ncbi:MAG: prolyl oligopeptidase family serine peptidase [Candidatus Bipolaricaulia bacterium]